jgi:hypothetical protein
MAARKPAAPEITDAQRAFVKASEEAEGARLAKEREQLEAIGRAQHATARQQRRAARLLWAVAALALAMVGFATWESYDIARREMNVFTARATDALNDEQFDRAMRYALQVYPARGRFPWTTPFSTELEGKLAGGALSTRLHRLFSSVAGFSAAGKRVLTASDGRIRIWDAESGNEIAVLKGYTGGVNEVALSADGKRVVTASSENTARIWDAESGNEMRF